MGRVGGGGGGDERGGSWWAAIAFGGGLMGGCGLVVGGDRVAKWVVPTGGDFIGEGLDGM